MTLIDMAKKAGRAVSNEIQEEIQERKDFRKSKKAIKKDAELKAYSKYAEKIMDKKYELQEKNLLTKSPFNTHGIMRKSIKEDMR